MSCSIAKECAKIWKDAQALAESASSAVGTGPRLTSLTESGRLKVDIAAVAKACRNSELARRYSLFHCCMLYVLRLPDIIPFSLLHAVCIARARWYSSFIAACYMCCTCQTLVPFHCCMLYALPLPDTTSLATAACYICCTCQTVLPLTVTCYMH